MIEQRTRLLKDVRARERRWNVGGIDTGVLEAGAGPPLMLLHGGIECGGVYWAPVMSALAARYVARMDEETFAQWFSSLLWMAGRGAPVTLVAHSLLGRFAARFAAEHPDHLGQVLIYGAPGIGPYRMPLGVLATAIRFDLFPSERNEERFERWAFLNRDRAQARDPEWFKAFSYYCVTLATVPHVKRTMRQLVKLGTKRIEDPVLRAIRTPVALVWGRHDRMVPLTLAERASSLFRWPLHVVEDAGHVPHLEQPERFVAALENAITQGEIDVHTATGTRA